MLFAQVMLLIFRWCLLLPKSDLSHHEVMITFLINNYRSFSITVNIPKTNQTLRSMISKLEQWPLLRPRVISTTKIKFLAEFTPVIVSPIRFDYIILLGHTKLRSYETPLFCLFFLYVYMKLPWNKVFSWIQLFLVVNLVFRILCQKKLKLIQNEVFQVLWNIVIQFFPDSPHKDTPSYNLKINLNNLSRKNLVLRFLGQKGP